VLPNIAYTGKQIIFGHETTRHLHLEDLDVDGKMILKWILKEQSGRVWTGLIWLRIETRDGLL
jgi:hypothetical protein